jgi:hypothetical protein
VCIVISLDLSASSRKIQHNPLVKSAQSIICTIIIYTLYETFHNLIIS